MRTPDRDLRRWVHPQVFSISDAIKTLVHLLTFIRLLFLINAVCNICKVNVFTQFICFDLIQKLYVTARAWRALFDKFEKKNVIRNRRESRS